VIWEESPIRGGLCLDGLHSTLTDVLDAMEKFEQMVGSANIQ
jgi:hypothetical protein